jgi:hypothetical protein
MLEAADDFVDAYDDVLGRPDGMEAELHGRFDDAADFGR